MPLPSAGAPFSEKYEILSALGHGSSGTTYRVLDASNRKIMALKHIPIPASEAQVQALIFSGAAGDEAEVQNYYERSAEDLREELRLGAELAGTQCFLPFCDCQFDRREGAVGYDIYLVSELCQTLGHYLAEHEATVLDVLNLGLDICSCIQALREHGLMHHNVKPENIYRTANGKFLLGDLGLTRLDELPYASLPDSRFGWYSAPEYADLLAPLNQTAEIYSLGMILYRIFNGNHAPFVDEETSIRAADQMRIEGKELPAPMYADYELSGIILKACAFRPEDRYQTAEEFRQELTMYMKRNPVPNAPVMPPIVTDPDEQLPADLEDSDDEALINFTNVDDLDEAFITHFSPVAHEAAAEAAGEIPPEPEPQLTEFSDAPAEPVNVTHRKSRVWIAVLAVLLVLAAAAVAIWFYLRGPAVTVQTMGTTDVGVDNLTVYIDCDAGSAALEVVCSDAYGNVISQPYSGTSYTFTELSPGTTYTITLQPSSTPESGFSFASLRGVRIQGTSSIQVTTGSVTQVVSFSAGSITGTSAELSLVIDGPEPEQWVLSYSADNGDSGSFEFTSHTLSLQDLIPNTTYTFTIEPADDFAVEGQLSCTFTTTASATLTSFEATEVTPDAVTLVWEYEGATDMWTVTCTGTDGAEVDAQQTTDNTITFTGLTLGETYTFALDCAGLQASSLSTCTVTTPTGTVTSMSAEAVDTTSVSVSWEYEGEAIAGGWMVIYTVESSEPIRSAVTTEDVALTLENLIPGASYTIELATASGVMLPGDSSISLTMPEAETFDDLGLDSAFVGLFLEPDTASWTYRDLSESRSEFLPSESIAFAVQALNGVQASDNTVQVLYVVRNAAGEPVDYYAHTYDWNSMWSNDLHVGALERTPQQTGDYTFEIYIDGQLLRTREFSIVDSLS